MNNHQVLAQPQAQPNTQPSAAAWRGVARPTCQAKQAIASSGSGQAAVWTKARVCSAPAMPAHANRTAVCCFKRGRRPALRPAAPP